MEKDKAIRSAKSTFTQSIENTLKEHKKRVGDVIYVTINARTTFEFPAHFTTEEIETRIANYKKRHNPLI